MTNDTRPNTREKPPNKAGTTGSISRDEAWMEPQVTPSNRLNRKASFRSGTSPYHTENETNDSDSASLLRHNLWEDDDDDDNEDFMYRYKINSRYAAGFGDPRRLTWAGEVTSTPVAYNGGTRARGWTPRRRQRWLRRRTGQYDEDGAQLISENNGIRVWYEDYTTIGIFKC